MIIIIAAVILGLCIIASGSYIGSAIADAIEVKEIDVSINMTVEHSDLEGDDGEGWKRGYN